MSFNRLSKFCRQTPAQRMAAGLCLLALTGAAGAVQAQSSLRITDVTEASHPYTTWQCAQKPVKVRMLGTLMEVVVDGDSRILQPAVSASGARYVAPGDENTEFWGKGGQASITWSGAALPDCVEAGTLPTPLRASGNEPFWSVDYDGIRVALSQPGEAVRHFPVKGVASRTDGWAVSAVEGGESLRLEITQATCVDSMSGLSRPYSVALKMNEQTLQGCGGDPERLLQGVRWQLESLGEQAVTVPAWLEFLPENRLAGSNGCNRLMGSYAVSGEDLRFGQLGSTRMACPPEIMAQADTIDRYLSGVRGFSFDEHGALVLAAEQGDMKWQAAQTTD